jgi:hypothetical protein
VHSTKIDDQPPGGKRSDIRNVLKAGSVCSEAQVINHISHVTETCRVGSNSIDQGELNAATLR